ncbi:MAG: dipeptide epimerase, partial [Verrucomicrobia bacterium]|nr:dipeptide epimerase [Verrucomicrobiota bacterium]
MSRRSHRQKLEAPAKLTWEPMRLEKQAPLVISRGARTCASFCWIKLESEGITGWGEAGEYSIGTHRETLNDILTGLQTAAGLIRRFDPTNREGIERCLRDSGIPSSVIAGIAQCLWDWLGKQTGQPVWRLLGSDPSQAPPTSVTIGIGTPQAAQQRVADWMKRGRFLAWKLKMGSPGGVKEDRRLFDAVSEVLPEGIHISVDANGGWNLADAISMSRWLARRGVDHMEQPLPRGMEKQLKQLKSKSHLPVLVDESCLRSEDIPPLAASVDGINIKLMKCGGISEALRMIQVARAFGLRTMLGCYSNSALGNI